MLIELYHNAGFVNILFDQKSGNRDNRHSKLLIRMTGMLFSMGNGILVKHGFEDQQFLVGSLSADDTPVPEKTTMIL